MNDIVVAVLKSTYSAMQSWIVCLSGALFFFYIMLQMTLFNSVSSFLMQIFHINSVQLGSLSSAYFWGDALLILPAGLLLDRFSTRSVILILMFFSAMSVFIFGMTHSLVSAYFCRMIIGGASAFAIISVMRLIMQWMPADRAAFAVGIIVTIGMLGAIIAQTPLVYLLSLVSWHEMMLGNGILGVLIWVIQWFFLSEKATKGTVTKSKLNICEDIKLVISKRQNWLLGLFSSFMDLPILMLGSLWCNLYLTQARHLPVHEASLVTCMIFFGMILGSPTFGKISDVLERRKLPMIIGSAAIILVMLVIVLCKNLSFVNLLGLFLLLGFFSSSQTLSFPAVAESNFRHLSSTATSFVCLIFMMVGAILQPAFGWMLKYNVDPLTQLFSWQNYQWALLIMPIGFGISLFSSFFIEETYCKNIHGS